jgi:hypothetical protein
VPVAARSNTTQHTYRWAQMLTQLLPRHRIDAGMVTHLAAPLEQQKRLVAAASPRSPFYFTGSRPVARAIRDAHPNAIASTGGPNTLVSTSLTPAVAAAVRLSATIENSGQCTARPALPACTPPARTTSRPRLPLPRPPLDLPRRCATRCCRALAPTSRR